MKTKFVYIEDEVANRREGIKEFARFNYSDNIIAPESLEECQNVLETFDYKGILSDYNLSEWVGKNEQKAIVLGDNKCYNGVEIAEQLLKRSKDIEIGLYSSNEPALMSELNKSKIKDDVELVSQINDPVENVNRSLTDFIGRKLSQLNIIAKPLHRIVDELPIEIQTFFAKKVINSFEPGEYLWKAGQYSWLVGINKDISYRYAEIEESDKYNINNPEEKFLINLDKNEQNLEWIQDKILNIKLDFKNILIDGSIPTPKRFIHNYFITQAICNRYIAREIKLETAINSIKTLGDYSMFQSQKILFKELSQNESIQTTCKEEIYDLLGEFNSNGYQQILDIYKCRVDLLENEVGFVKLMSFSPENVVRVEKFSSEFLSDHHILNEDAEFEYTIYRTSIGGGSAYHIEPI